MQPEAVNPPNKGAIKLYLLSRPSWYTLLQMARPCSAVGGRCVDEASVSCIYFCPTAVTLLAANCSLMYAINSSKVICWVSRLILSLLSRIIFTAAKVFLLPSLIFIGHADWHLPTAIISIINCSNAACIFKRVARSAGAASSAFMSWKVENFLSVFMSWLFAVNPLTYFSQALTPLV